MKKEIAEKWADALESGKYKQTPGALRKGNAFCCLGVLCNLHAQEHPNIAAEETDPNQYLGESAGLPDEVQEWSGMRHDLGVPYVNGDVVINKRRYESLAEANDNRVRFKTIAKYIRANYKAL